MAAAAANMDLSYLASVWAPLPVGLSIEQLMTPSGLPPNGTMTNFVDPPSMQTTIRAVCSVMVGLTIIFVSLRLYSVLHITRSMGYEDYVCLAATAFSFGYAAIIMYLAGAARHMYDVPYWWFNDVYWKERYAENTLQAFAFPATRISFFLLFLRVFGQNNKTFRYACYAGMIGYSVAYFLFIPLNAIYCAPPPGQAWAGAGVLQKCEGLIPFSFFLGACNIVGDLYIIILPLPMIWRLHMTLEKKLGVMAIFFTGVFVLIASAVSMFYRFRLSYGGDTNWFEGSLVCATVSELCVAIIAGCMPSLSSLFKHYSKGSSFFASFRSAFRSLRGGTSGSSAAAGGSAAAKTGKSMPWSKEASQISSHDTLKSEHDRPDSRSQLRDPRYVELGDWDGSPKPELVSYVYGPTAEDGRVVVQEKGIMKSVDVVKVAQNARR